MSLEGRAVARLAKLLEVALTDADLSPSQYRMLILLADGSAAASVLASKLAISPPSVTALIDGLVARGLVSRTTAERDRRRVDHALTAKGMAALEAADRVAAARLAEVAEHAGIEALAALHALDVWAEAMNRYRDAEMAK